jgi:hypothetical protein
MTRPCRAEPKWGLARLRLSMVAIVLGATTGCFPPDEGQEPDPNAIYFPTGVALNPVEGPRACPQDATTADPKHKWLYVANSDFDLQYNAGTVQALDLDKIDQVIAAMNAGAPEPEERCPNKFTAFGQEFNFGDGPEDGKKSESDQFVAPGLCKPVPTAPFITSSVKIGAFATDIRYLKRPDGNGPDMLVVPIRGDRSLHWIDTNPNPENKDAGPLLDCGVGEDGRCDDDHRRGNEPAAENTRNAELPREPFGVAADDRGEAIVTTHQSDGALALFVNDWSQTSPKVKGPQLQFVLRDRDNIPLGAVGIASIPEPDIALALRGTASSTFYEPGYYTTFRNSAQVSLIRYFSDQGEFQNPESMGTSPARSFLELGGAAPIVTNSQGFDSRGIAVDSSQRHECECKCRDNPGPPTCRTDCVETDPSAGRDPEAVRVAEEQKTASCDPNADPPGPCASYVQCLRSCAPTPLGVFVSNRTPASLIVGRTSPNSSATASDDIPIFYDTENLQAGPSRVVAGSVRVPDGNGGTRPSGRAFVICFDSRQIFVYDPEAPINKIESVIRTGRGPHALVVDETRGLGYIAHFTDSYVGVVDLDQTHTNTYGKIVLSIGPVVPPRAQK